MRGHARPTDILAKTGIQEFKPRIRLIPGAHLGSEVIPRRCPSSKAREYRQIAPSFRRRNDGIKVVTRLGIQFDDTL